MPTIEKIETWSVYEHFEASSLEEALELAQADEADDWTHLEDDSVDYFVKES